MPEAIYEGTLDRPKTEASVRLIPLADPTDLLQTWRQRVEQTAPEDLIFGTASGTPISPTNVLR
jgi:hypothetical protein